MSTADPIKIASLAGIKRDGTTFEGTNYSDGLWCRFDARARPKKMAGYSAITALPEVSRGLDLFPGGGTYYVHSGSQSHLEQIQVLPNGTLGGGADRTPGAYVANANTLWQFAQFFNLATTATTLCAHAGQNLNDITNLVETPIYFGPVQAATALAPSGGGTPMPSVAGGVLALPPYLIGYSINGRIDVSAVNDFTTLGGSTFESDTKIIKGLPLRNGQGGPAGLFWSLDQLIVATFNAAITTGVPFSFNIVSDDVSPLSSQGIIEFDGIYYWAEIDHFSIFNGVVMELPNNMNIDFFFDNLNYTYRQKVFCFKVPRWGEIWWCAPLFGATECNWAVIYNTRLKTWYDTPLPPGFRTAATSPKVLQYPLMADTGSNLTSNNPTLWLHEFGLDAVAGGQVNAIQSYIQTHEISPVLAAQKDKAFRVSIVEPDFKQKGPLSVTVYGRSNPRLPQQAGTSVTLPDTSVPLTAANQLAMYKDNARLLSFRIQSFAQGADFRMGEPIAHVELTDGRMIT